MKTATRTTYDVFLHRGESAEHIGTVEAIDAEHAQVEGESLWSPLGGLQTTERVSVSPVCEDEAEAAHEPHLDLACQP